jgi:hypothetical protein
VYILINLSFVSKNTTKNVKQRDFLRHPNTTHGFSCIFAKFLG